MARRLLTATDAPRLRGRGAAVPLRRQRRRAAHAADHRAAGRRQRRAGGHGAGAEDHGRHHCHGHGGVYRSVHRSEGAGAQEQSKGSAAAVFAVSGGGELCGSGGVQGGGECVRVADQCGGEARGDGDVVVEPGAESVMGTLTEDSMIASQTWRELHAPGEAHWSDVLWKQTKQDWERR